MATVLLDLAPWPLAAASSVCCTDVHMYSYTDIFCIAGLMYMGSCGDPSIAILDQIGSRSIAPSINLAYAPLLEPPQVLLFDAESMRGPQAACRVTRPLR